MNNRKRQKFKVMRSMPPLIKTEWCIAQLKKLKPEDIFPKCVKTFRIEPKEHEEKGVDIDGMPLDAG